MVSAFTTSRPLGINISTLAFEGGLVFLKERSGESLILKPSLKSQSINTLHPISFSYFLELQVCCDGKMAVNHLQWAGSKHKQKCVPKWCQNTEQIYLRNIPVWLNPYEITPTLKNSTWLTFEKRVGLFLNLG